MVYRIDIENLAGKTGTIETQNFTYVDPLNQIREGVLKFESLNSSDQALLQEGSKLLIYRDGVQQLYGEVATLERFQGGSVKATFTGKEITMARENGNYANSPWTATASATIFNSAISEASEWSPGTIATGLDIDFRLEKSDSILNACGDLISKTGQDIIFDDSNPASLKVDISDHRGSATSVATLNDGLEISNISYRRTYPTGNYVIVYGKGDGANQIKSESSSGQDAGSQSTYGVIVKTVLDPTAVSVSEANQKADILVPKFKDPVKVYLFNVNDLSSTIGTGDVITINSKDVGLEDEEVRVTAVERGIKNNREFLSFEVVNKEFSETLIKVGQEQMKLSKQFRDTSSYMQGTTNILTFSEMINGNSSAPLRVKSYLEESFIKDEVGNLRVNSFTLDYDVDPFRSGVGSATEDDVAPTVSGTSASTTPGVSGDSGSTSPGVSGDSGSTAPGVSGDSGSHNVYTSVGSDSLTTVSCSSGSWTTVATVRPGSSYLNQDLVAEMTILGSSGGAEDIEVRIGNDSVYGYIDPGTSGSGASVWATYMDGFRDTSMSISGGIAVGTVTSSTHDIFVQVRPQTGAISLRGALNVMTIKHTHDDGTYAAANHDHSDGSYAASNHDHSDGSYAASSHGHADGSYGAASHNHNVSIGDGVSDSGSLNATEVSIYVDFWSGSAWVNKHSILNTGKTIDFNVDISNGGTYPDAPGFWRARVFTDNATGDLVQGTIKCKHQLDS